jgi:Holliday junction resolvasome RuvABC endonuclease subunit
MSKHPRACLGFDTSAKGGAALLREHGPEDPGTYPVRVDSWTVPFGTPGETARLTEIFTAAKALREAGYMVSACAEQPQGFDTRGQTIRAGANQRIGVLKVFAGLFAIPWGGEIAPNTAKLALTGSGTADKGKVQKFCLAIFKVRPADDNEADAHAVALAGLYGRFIIRQTGGRCHTARPDREAAKSPQGRLW